MWIDDLGSCWPCANSCLFNVCLMIKHSSTTLDHVCEVYLKNKKKIMEHHTIPSMAKVVLYWWGLYILVGASFCAWSTLVGFPHHLVHLPRTHTHLHVLCMQSWSTLCFCPHASPSKSTPHPHLKKEILLGFKFELIMIWKFNPCL